MHSTYHSHCSALYEPLWGVIKGKARLISEIRLEFLTLAGIPVAMLIEGIFVVFLWHWNWDNLFTPLEDTRAARTCSLECTDVSSITAYTSGTQYAANYVCPLTTTNCTSPSLFLLDPLPTPGSLVSSLPFFSFSSHCCWKFNKKISFLRTCSQL